MDGTDLVLLFYLKWLIFSFKFTIVVYVAVFKLQKLIFHSSFRLFNCSFAVSFMKLISGPLFLAAYSSLALNSPVKINSLIHANSFGVVCGWSCNSKPTKLWKCISNHVFNFQCSSTKFLPKIISVQGFFILFIFNSICSYYCFFRS